MQKEDTAVVQKHAEAVRTQDIVVVVGRVKCAFVRNEHIAVVHEADAATVVKQTKILLLIGRKALRLFKDKTLQLLNKRSLLRFKK